jgi:hypothetical protein
MPRAGAHRPRGAGIRPTRDSPLNGPPDGPPNGPPGIRCPATVGVR